MNLIKATLLILLNLVILQAVGQTCKDTIPASTPTDRFVINGEEVTDTVTGLIWQRCSLGQSGANCEQGSAMSYTWSGALQAAQAQGQSWRLPNLKELRSIVEEKCYNPAINLDVFPGTPSSDFWSASPGAYGSGGAWYVGFYYGGSGYYGKGSSARVRLVRAGQ